MARRASYWHFPHAGDRMMRRLAFLVGLLGLVFSVAAAGDDVGIKRVKAKLTRAFPELSGATVGPAPVPGLYEIEYDAKIFYTTQDGKYLFSGDVLDLGTRTNLTEARRTSVRAGMIRKLNEENMIVMGPDRPKRTLTVFTDVDCPYCARFHLDVPTLNKYGVKVRYLFYPRAGLKSESYRRAVAVWCADDRVKAIGIAKAGGSLDMKTCPNPVEKDYQLGRQLDISGTPTIVFDDGKVLPGYVPARQLLSMLGIKTEPPTTAVQ
jgi:thiol:disulfide interchange protein DsbC